ncbi:MAG: hypothetical protein ACLRT5_15265 [Lachnospiraceae bacterium]
MIQLLFIAEQYLGKTLSPAETSRVCCIFMRNCIFPWIWWNT